MGESSIAKSGNVSFQVKGFMRSSWQPRFLVLYSGSSDTHPHIELYDNQDKFNETKEANKKCDKKIDLNRVKYINKSTQKSSSGVDHIIEIQCKKDKHVFSVDNEYEFNDWDYRLNKVVSVLPEKGGENSSHTDPGGGDEVVTANLMYEQTSESIQFNVDVKEDKLALLCGIAGRHLLNISDREIAFEEIGTRRMKYSFNYSWLRKFGKKEGVFFFECGRKCPSGEGEIQCFTDEAAKVHQIIISKSQQNLNSLRAPEPSRTKSLPTPVQHDSAQPAHTKASSRTLPADIDSNIGAPSLATNAVRKHPGLVKQPELIPIRPASASERTSPPVPKRTVSVSDRRSTSNSSKGDSIKKHGPVSENFTKELEHKIHSPAVEAARLSKHEDKPPKDLRISKDKKKSEKEDKKKMEKEDKRKSEKEDKKSEKEGKKDKKSDKEMKKGNEDKKSKGLFSGKKKDKEEKEKSKPAPTQINPNFYEDVDQCLNKPKTDTNESSANYIYDEAISPKTKVHIAEPVEYATPYAKKGMSNVGGSDAAMYSDVKGVPDKAWITHGQEEEIHEEDYLNIKDAREMKEKEMKGRENVPPPLPQKLYDLDDTYNTLDHGHITKPAAGAGALNIYGTAGAKPVGRIDIVQTPNRPPKGSISESEGSSGEIYEGSDEEQQEDGYEDTVITTKPALKPMPAPQPKWQGSALYEEIPSPPVASPVKLKHTQSFQESVYDEVS